MVKFARYNDCRLIVWSLGARLLDRFCLGFQGLGSLAWGFGLRFQSAASARHSSFGQKQCFWAMLSPFGIRILGFGVWGKDRGFKALRGSIHDVANTALQTPASKHSDLN